MGMSPELRNRLLGMAGASSIAIAGVMIPGLEGVSHTAYQDIAGIPTVCYGHTGPDIIVGKKYSESECQTLLKKDLIPANNAVNRLVKVPSTEYQKAALTTFAYNVGVGAFERSSLLKDLNAGHYNKACDGLMKWTYAAGKQWKGLINRREIEREVCLWGQK